MDLTAALRRQVSVVRAVVFWACLLALSAGGVGLVLYSTPFGLGLSWDSFTYISSARGLIEGQGLARLTGCGELKPMTGYPPLYPAALAGLEWAGLKAVRAARAISALSLGATVMLTGILARRLARSGLAAVLAALLALGSSTLLAVFSWAWTEPPFVVLCLGCLLFLSQYLESRRPWALLVASACMGLAMLLRYAGLALLATMLAALLIDLRSRRSNGAAANGKAIAAALALGTIPLALWLARNFSLRGNFVNRHLEWHPLGAQHLSQFSQTLAAWLLPAGIHPLGQPMTRHPLAGSMAGWVAALAAVALLLGAIWMAARWRSSRRLDPESLLLTWIVVYLAFIAVSLMLFDPRIPLDDRILSPIFVPALLLAAAGGVGVWRKKRRALRLLAVCAAFALVGLHATQLVPMIQALRSDGQGYAATQWRSSVVLESLRDRQPEPVYTNEIPAVYFSAGLSACSIPVRGASQALEEMRRALRVPGAALVLFGPVSPEYVPEEELTRGLIAMPSLPWDGRVFVYGGEP